MLRPNSETLRERRLDGGSGAISDLLRRISSIHAQDSLIEAIPILSLHALRLNWAERRLCVDHVMLPCRLRCIEREG